MVAAKRTNVNDSLIDFLLERLKPDDILAYQASEAEQERADELAEKNKDGTLTPEEARELRQMLEADRLVMALKTRALELIDES